MWQSKGPGPGILPLLMVPSQVHGASMAPSLLRTVTTALCSLTLCGSSPPRQVHLHRSCSWLESSRGRRFQFVSPCLPSSSLVLIVSPSGTLAAASTWSPGSILTWLPALRKQREPVRVQVGDTGPRSQALGVSYSLSSQWGPRPHPPKSPPPPGPAHKDPREPLLWPDGGPALASAQGAPSLPASQHQLSHQFSCPDHRGWLRAISLPMLPRWPTQRLSHGVVFASLPPCCYRLTCVHQKSRCQLLAQKGIVFGDGVPGRR